MATDELTATIDECNRDPRPLAMPSPDGSDRGLTLEEMIGKRLATSTTVEEVARVLHQLLYGGYAVWPDGTILETRALVAAIGGLRIDIRSNEHPPPHFHVLAAGINASFAIRDCAHLKGSIGAHERRKVEVWHAGARPLLVRKWNASRPTDCSVGPIDDC